MGIEPEVRRFLSNIMFSIGIGLLWLIINITLGIFFGWMFFVKMPTVGNYIYYGWFVLSFAALIIILVRRWQEKFPHD